MFSYKAFDSSFSCLGLQFQVGETYSISETPVLCQKGYHSCMVPINVWHYYDDIFNNRYALIENIGEVVKGDDKIVCNKIKIIREIPREEFESLSGCFVDEQG